ACVPLVSLGVAHESSCVMRAAGLELTTLGWASGLSQALRSDLRRGTDLAYRLSTRLVSGMIRSHAAYDSPGTRLIVPIPTSGSKDSVSVLAGMVGTDVGLPVLHAVVRTKRRSTRDSAAVRRAAIARQEYSAHLSAREV